MWEISELFMLEVFKTFSSRGTCLFINIPFILLIRKKSYFYHLQGRVNYDYHYYPSDEATGQQIEIHY